MEDILCVLSQAEHSLILLVQDLWIPNTTMQAVIQILLHLKQISTSALYLLSDTHDSRFPGTSNQCLRCLLTAQFITPCYVGCCANSCSILISLVYVLSSLMAGFRSMKDTIWKRGLVQKTLRCCERSSTYKHTKAEEALNADWNSSLVSR